MFSFFIKLFNWIIFKDQLNYFLHICLGTFLDIFRMFESHLLQNSSLHLLYLFIESLHLQTVIFVDGEYLVKLFGFLGENNLSSDVLFRNLLLANFLNFLLSFVIEIAIFRINALVELFWSLSTYTIHWVIL